MSKIKFLAGSIAGGIIVAAIIVTLVMNSSTELTSEEVTNVVKDDFIETGDPTKIKKFTVEEAGNSKFLSLTADGKIPHDGKQLPISESAKSYGYAWLRLEKGADDFHHIKDSLVGYIATIRPGDDGSSPERWWNVQLVSILQIDPDDPLCLISSKETFGIISVTQNEIKVELTFLAGSPSPPLDRAMVIAIEYDETCHNGNAVRILDSKI